MKNKIILFVSFIVIVTSKQIFAETQAPEPCVSTTFIGSQSSQPKAYLHLKDFPKNQKITCSIKRPLLRKENALTQFKINDLGKIVFPDNREENAIEISGLGYFQGEKVIATFSLEGKAIALTSFIPCQLVHQIPGTDLVLSAELIMMSSITNYELSINGIPRGEKFIFQSKSGKEILRDEIIAEDAQGFGYSPDVVGSSGGFGEISIITQKGTLSLQLPWGIRLFDAPKPRK